MYIKVFSKRHFILLFGDTPLPWLVLELSGALLWLFCYLAHQFIWCSVLLLLQLPSIPARPVTGTGRGIQITKNLVLNRQLFQRLATGGGLVILVQPFDLSWISSIGHLLGCSGWTRPRYYGRRVGSSCECEGNLGDAPVCIRQCNCSLPLLYGVVRSVGLWAPVPFRLH